jgi:hypothetical protein
MQKVTKISDRMFLGVLLALLLVALLASCARQLPGPTIPPPDDTPPIDEPGEPTPDPEGWEPLFPEGDLSGWYSWFESTGRGDPDGAFKLEDGVLHILDVPEGARDQGFLASLETYGSYHLRFEYMWGEKRFDNGNAPRGGGLLYHAGGPDKIWPRSLEFQLQEGDTGDLWFIGRTSAETTVVDAAATPPQYQEGGEAYTTTPAPFSRLVKSETFDKAEGWNEVELIVGEDEIVHIVNGEVNNRVMNPMQLGTSGEMVALGEGRIVFQAQNSEIMLRNLEIMPLDSDTP